jgi:diacylglycerol kinase family enzyme
MTTAAPAYGGLTPHVRIKRVEVVINHMAGSVGPGADEAMAEIIADHGLKATISAPAPADIPTAVAEALARKPDLLIVLAGDGTAGLAAGLAGPKGPLVMPLPGGTMNMLPHALYGRIGWKDALVAALATGVERPVSGGVVLGSHNGRDHPFYCAAILGAPALWAEAREAIRARKPREALRRAMRALSLAFKGRLRFQLDGGPKCKAEALTLLCPLISRAMIEDDALEAAALDVQNAIDAFRIGAAALLPGVDWRDDPTVTSQPVKRAVAWASARIPAVLDGEPIRLPKRFEVRFTPVAFRALAPAPVSTDAIEAITEKPEPIKRPRARAAPKPAVKAASAKTAKTVKTKAAPARAAVKPRRPKPPPKTAT